MRFASLLMRSRPSAWTSSRSFRHNAPGAAPRNRGICLQGLARPAEDLGERRARLGLVLRTDLEPLGQALIHRDEGSQGLCAVPPAELRARHDPCVLVGEVVE